jgi:transposase
VRLSNGDVCVRPYRRRNKTDRNDCDAILEAARCSGIHPVPVKTHEQQQVQQLHGLRELQNGQGVSAHHRPDIRMQPH